jgi:hypothetical protein
MPSMISFASGSIGGFGSLRSRVLTTYTFPSGTSTWTAPAGVTKIVSATGKGSDGTSDSWGPLSSGASYLGYALANYPFDPGYSQTSKTIGDAYTATAALYNTLASTVTATSPPGNFVSDRPFYEWFPGWPTPNWTCEERLTSFGSGTFYRGGSLSMTNGFTPGDTTPLSFLNSSLYAYINGLYVLTPGASGYQTQGFGQNWSGGAAGSPATLVTINNITVSPGTTYTVYNNGSLTIRF